MTRRPRTADAEVLIVSIGAVGDLPYRGRSVPSAFAKRPVVGGVGASTLGLAGDERGDRVAHGGPDKALCVYPAEHYPTLEAVLGRPLAAPAFGENLTTCGLLEDEVCIGDRMRVGGALVEVSLPRNPCFKIAARHGDKRLVAEFERSGRTGWYLRVLEPGNLRAGAAVSLVDRLYPEATIAEANRLMHQDRRDWEAIRGLLECPALADAWRRTFTRRLERGQLEDPASRRLGPDHAALTGARPPRGRST